jgi:hypothetical protein
MATELKGSPGKGLTDTIVVTWTLTSQGWRLRFRQGMLVSNISRSMKFSTTLTHYIDNVIGFSLHGKVDFAKKNNNSCFGFSLTFGTG